MQKIPLPRGRLFGSGGYLAGGANSVIYGKRVVRSTLAAKTLSLEEGVEVGIHLRTLIEEILRLPQNTIKLEAIVNNNDAVEAIYSAKDVDDQLLRINVGALKESLERSASLIRWCKGEDQLANCMTKQGTSGFIILGILQSGHLGS